MLTRTRIILLMIVIPMAIWANSGRFYPSNRLSSGLITSICQDKYGYIWIGTEYGLNKFDGYNFTQFLHDRQDSTTIIDNDISSLFVSRDGTLWVGCSKGLARYDYETNRFIRYHFPDERTPRVITLIEDEQAKLIIGTVGYGLYAISKGNAYIEYMSNLNRRKGDAYFGKVFIDRQKAVWRGSHLDDLIHCALKNGQSAKTEDYKTGCGQPVAFIDYSADAMLIVCTWGILRYDYGSGRLEKADFDLRLLGDATIEESMMDNNGNLLIGTAGNGLMIIRRGQKQLERVENTNRDIDLRQTNVAALLEDRSGNLWIGCYNKGLLNLTQEKEAFETWSLTQQGYRTGGSISSIVRADDGGVWCAVKPGGIYKFDSQGHIDAHPSAPTDVHTLYRDGLGNYWLGTENALYQFHPQQGTWTKIRDFGGRGIASMADDGKGTLYLSIFGLGLCIYDTRSHQAEMLTMQQKDRREGYLCNDWIETLLMDSRGMLWIGTAGGVSVMKPEGRVFNSMGWNTLLADTKCDALCETANGNMLLSTDIGLYLYDWKRNKAEPLTGNEQLANKQFGSMVCDKNGTIWMSSTMGIWQLSKDFKTVIAHINGNGLAEREYIGGAVLHTADDRIYFGTPDGITTFQPSEVKTRGGSLSRVLLTGITVNGSPLNPMQDRFELNYRENTLTLEFSLLNFRNAENISYEWRINGADVWQHTSEGENRITLAKLQPGAYILEVIASNNGIVSESPHLIRLIIHQPWYKSPLAYIFYIILAVSLIGLIFYNLERQQRRNLEETKMRFLINATHDIRSPLTLIMGPLKKLKQRVTDTESQRDIETIDKNAQRLLLLVNQILDERKIDKGQMRLSCQETDLNAFVGGIFKLYEYNAQQRRIRYTFDHPEAPVKVWIDRRNFDKVISNLLSNAFKYTFDEGEIGIRLTQDEREAEIQVIDSGLGFEDDRTERFFERFYQGRNSKDLHIDGTGIGLNLSRAITEMHGGRITAENRKNGERGAILTVRLPLGKEHLKPEEIEEDRGERSEVRGERSEANRNLNILVVDDDAEIGRYISQELAAWYRFDYAENGREALKRLLTTDTRPYDLVISDVMMPEMDGLTLLRSIKQNPVISDIPVILLTSKSEVSYRLEGLKKGADAYLSKPFNMEELHILIDNLVDNVRRLRGKFTGATEQKDKVENVEVKGNNDALMDRVMKVINAHLSDPDLNMDVLTQEVGISRAQLHRKMKELTGIPTTEFIRNLRLEQAARLIKENKINITQVAYSVGFNNQAHFSTVFKKHFGMTPTEYAEHG